MKAAVIIIAVIAFLLILLFCPVCLSVCSDENGSRIFAKYLFFSKKLYPPKQSKRKKEKAKTRQKPKSEKKESFTEKLNNTVSTVSAASSLLRLFLSLVSIKAQASVKVVGKDAADTAITCGKYYALASSAVGTLSNFVKIKKQDFSFVPDYEGEKTVWEAKGEIILYPICLLFNVGKIVESLLSLVK